MAVTLVVEDGTGRSDANSLVAIDAFKSYCDDRGLSYSTYSDDQISTALIRASAFLSNAFQWQGIRVKQRQQTMCWPRIDMFDKEGWNILQTEVPREVIAATCEVALYEATNPGAMTPQVVLADKVQSEQVGSIRVEYANLFSSASASRPVLTIVQDLLAPFLDIGISQSNLLRV